MTTQEQIDRSIALSAVFFFTKATHPVANYGEIDKEILEVAATSILKMDAPDVGSIYGGRMNLCGAFQLLLNIFTQKQQDPELMRQVVTVLHLQKKLMRRNDLIEKIQEAIPRIQQQAEYFSVTHDNVIASLADLYVETISTLTPRIIIGGEQVHLTNTYNIAAIRTLLFAAIRSAVLWKQKGGSRLQFLFGKKNTVEIIKELTC